ncbi:MAG: alcohol dehydrogenase [Flavobacteriaceae bacterium]|nr:alcohol dehydrogenase [Flavobacteriaceae bacterium]
MKQILLGNTSLHIAPIIFGGNVFGWTLNEQESFQMLDAISDLGINCIDTADVYSRWYNGNSGGESETIIGKWMKSRGNREQFIICTKVGMDMGQGGVDISEQHILKSVDDSLKRLQTDYIDLYYAHKDDETTPPQETLGAFQKLIDAGKVRYIGASNFSAARLEESITVSKNSELPLYRVIQPEYNLINRTDFEGDVERVCRKHELGVVTYFSLASGLLTGKYETEADVEKSSRTSFVKKHFNDRTRQIVATLQNIAKTHHSSPAAVALAWILHHPTVTAPIVSATRKEHLKALEKAAFLELTIDEKKMLDKVSAN